MIESDGFSLEDLIKDLEHIEVSNEMQRKALKAGAEILKNATEEAAPKGSGRLGKGIKYNIKKIDGDICAVIRTNSFYDIFTNFGTSFASHDVGWWDRTIEDNEDKATKAISEVLFK